MSMSERKETIHLICTCLHQLYALLYMQEPRKSARDINGKVHVPKEGRGQRQRRKKREGAGPDGQPRQPSAPSRPIKASAGTRHTNAAGHDTAADVRPAKRSRLTTDPAGASALHPAYHGHKSMHMQGDFPLRSSLPCPTTSTLWVCCSAYRTANDTKLEILPHQLRTSSIRMSIPGYMRRWSKGQEGQEGRDGED